MESQEVLDTPKQRRDYIRKNKLYSDCQFKIGERIFDAHRLILAISSSVFEEMLYVNGGLDKSNNEPIQITDIEPEAFESLLDYIYSNRLTINSLEGATNLAYAADKYLIISLPEKCWSFIDRNFNSRDDFMQKIKFCMLFRASALRLGLAKKLREHPEKRRTILMVYLFNLKKLENKFPSIDPQIRKNIMSNRSLPLVKNMKFLANFESKTSIHISRPIENFCLHYIRKSKLFSDCQFKVGEKIFDAHKLILAISSPVFEAMLYGTLAESTKEPILLADIEPEAFECLLDYIYAQSPKFGTVEIAINLMCTANQYLMPSLQKKCSNYIQNRLNYTNVFQAYEFAVLHEDSSLKSKSLNYIKGHTSDALKYCDYANISIDTLLTVLKQDVMLIKSELELFEALEKFAENNGCFTVSTENNGTQPSAESNSNTIDSVKQTKLREAINCIRFLRMTPEEFISGPSTSKLLLPHESSKILAKLKSPDTEDLPYPEGFSKITTSRIHFAWDEFLENVTSSLSFP